MQDELLLFQDVGPRKIDVIVYKGYEHRRERGSQCHKFNQKWVCRYAKKTKCKGKFKLAVRDLTNFLEEASITSFYEHNHEPHPISDLATATGKDASTLITQGGVSTDSVEMSTPESTLLTTTKFWQLMGISQPEHDTYLAVICVRRPRCSEEQENILGY